MGKSSFGNVGNIGVGSHLSTTDKSAAVGGGKTLLDHGVTSSSLSVDKSFNERSMGGPEKTTAKQVDPNISADQQKSADTSQQTTAKKAETDLGVDESYEAKNKPPTPFTASGKGMDGHERTTEKKTGIDEKAPAPGQEQGADKGQERSNDGHKKAIEQFMNFDHTRDRDGKVSLGETGKHISPQEMKIFKKAAVAAGMKSAFATKEPHELTGKELKEGFKELGDYMMKAGEAAVKSDPSLAAAAELMENTVKGVKAHQKEKEQGKGGHGAEAEQEQGKQGGSRNVWSGLGSGSVEVSTGHDKLGGVKPDATPAKAPSPSHDKGIS